ncbi:hypothetical protein BN77_2293 [Rhizobium mesoamericanum STM3625]|uniref:Uncharacterized protein n=1 Tax=Rhizobium mesoamericanum STM3625 TaxID=1211777 RepID=K0PUQ2_9HYPH|nr:hypothetical protein BN77_2293 [Rhizobium mesoamericanum STM3625]
MRTVFLACGRIWEGSARSAISTADGRGRYNPKNAHDQVKDMILLHLLLSMSEQCLETTQWSPRKLQNDRQATF